MEKETYIGMLVIIVLVGIGTGVFIKQFYFNPAVLSVQQVTPKSAGLPDAPSNRSEDPAIPIPDGTSGIPNRSSSAKRSSVRRRCARTVPGRGWARS